MTMHCGRRIRLTTCMGWSYDPRSFHVAGRSDEAGMTQFWQTGFWQTGFWSTGFWGDEAASVDSPYMLNTIGRLMS